MTDALTTDASGPEGGTGEDAAAETKRTRSMGDLQWMEVDALAAPGVLRPLKPVQPKFASIEAARKWLSAAAEGQQVEPSTYRLVRVVETVQVSVAVVRQVTLTEAA